MSPNHRHAVAKRRQRVRPPGPRSKRPASTAPHLPLARALLREGKLDQAETVCDQILRIEPTNARALDLMGEIAYRRGAFEAALDFVLCAAERDPSRALYHAHLGVILTRLRRFDGAISAYRTALQWSPHDAEVHFNLGNTFMAAGEKDEAIASYRKAIASKSAFVSGYKKLAAALDGVGRFDEAVDAYRAVLSINPSDAPAQNQLGEALENTGQLREALAAYQSAIDLAPEFALAHLNFGFALMQDKRFPEAVTAIGRAIDLDPGNALAHYHLGNAFKKQGTMADAKTAYGEALKIDPQLHPSRFGLCMAELPIIYEDEADIDNHRAAYTRALQRLTTYYDDQCPRELEGVAAAIGSSQPFFLAYQGRVDRDLQALYGNLVCRLMASAYPQWSARPPIPGRDTDGRIRVGIVSGYFHSHSNWKIPIKGWAERLDRERFRLFGYHTQARRDHRTEEAVAAFDRFVQGPRTSADWGETIRSDELHVLIFPEIGMDPMTARLAALRLAPVQCSSWGHPNTSGYPTIDYFLSSDLMEPPDGHEHYTETLVRLPNLSIHYTPPRVAAATLTRADLGARDDAVLYWCCQSLFKYVPRFDDIFPRIAKKVGDCQFVFIRHPSDRVTDTFRARLDRAFAARGLSWDRFCVFSDRLRAPQFAAAMRVVDVFLDSVGWSGCNTTLEAFAEGLPAVTCRGGTMRARHTAAMLEMIGLDACIADTVDIYVNLAARMGSDPAWRLQIADRVVANRHLAFNDRACIEGLEAFLLNAVENAELGPADNLTSRYDHDRAPATGSLNP